MAIYELYRVQTCKPFKPLPSSPYWAVDDRDWIQCSKKVLKRKVYIRCILSECTTALQYNVEILVCASAGSSRRWLKLGWRAAKADRPTRGPLFTFFITQAINEGTQWGDLLLAPPYFFIQISGAASVQEWNIWFYQASWLKVKLPLWKIWKHNINNITQLLFRKLQHKHEHFLKSEIVSLTLCINNQAKARALLFIHRFPKAEVSSVSRWSFALTKG